MESFLPNTAKKLIIFIYTLSFTFFQCLIICLIQDESVAHIPEAEVKKVADETQKVTEWYNTMMQKQMTLKKYQNPVFTCAEVQLKVKVSCVFI